jgi:hypothetical protein
LTKYLNDKHRGRPNADTPIVAGDEWYGESRPPFICDHCHTILSKLIQRNGLSPSWYCNRCNVEYDPEAELRSKSKISMSEGPTTTPLASTKFPEPTVGRSPPPVRGTFAELQRRGMKIKNYKDEVKG